MESSYRKVKSLTVAAAMFLSWTPLARGEVSGVGDRGFAIGPRASYFKPKDAENGSWFAGAQVRLPVSSALGIEGSIDYRKNAFNDGVSVKAYPVQATLRVTLAPHSPFSPFLLGGAGWYFTQVDGPLIEKKTDDRFGLHAGGGLEVMLGRAVSLDGSYRYIWLEDATSRDQNAVEKNYRDRGSMITAALNLMF